MCATPMDVVASYSCASKRRSVSLMEQPSTTLATDISATLSAIPSELPGQKHAQSETARSEAEPAELHVDVEVSLEYSLCQTKPLRSHCGHRPAQAHRWMDG